MYNVPKGGPSNAIFASGLWIGGMVDGSLHLAGSTYGPYEFWAGPHDNAAQGEDCSAHNYMLDGRAYHQRLDTDTDYTINNWPAQYGAAFTDNDGDGRYAPESGDRPVVYGDQTIVWLMNDVGNQHTRSGSPPLGIEVLGHAIATDNETKEYLPQSTHYYYKVTNKSASDINDAYVGIYADPDLGNYSDDYVGSDSLLGLAYVYNGDNDDEGSEGYGAAPPALGYQILFGPEARVDGKDNDGDGFVDEVGERLGMSAFAFYNSGGGVLGDPGNGADMYNYMKGRWKDGQRFTVGGNGLGFSNTPTSFMFSGNPPEFWSELDSDGEGTAIPPADRRFVLSVGPFDLRAGETTDFYFSILMAFGSDNLDSVYKLKEHAADNRTWNTHPSKLPKRNRPRSQPASAPAIVSPGRGATNVPTTVSTHWYTEASWDLRVEVELWEEDYREETLQTKVATSGTSVSWSLDSLKTYSFRARFIEDLPGPWSPEWSFATGNLSATDFSSYLVDFTVTSNASGPLATPAGASADWYGFPGVGRPGSDQQVGSGAWLIHAGGGTGPYEQYLSRMWRNGVSLLSDKDLEIRFTGSGKALVFWGCGEVIDVPFELFVHDRVTSTEEQLVPLLMDDDDNCEFNLLAKDHPVSGASDDPYTDWIYGYYGDYAAEVQNGFDFGSLGSELFGRLVFVNWNGGDVSDGTLSAVDCNAGECMPELGTTFRISSSSTPLSIPLAPVSNQRVFGLNGTFFSWAGGSAMKNLVVARDSLLTDIIETVDNPTSGITLSLPEGEYFWAVTDFYERRTDPIQFTVTYTQSSAPTASIVADKLSGQAPVTIQFDGSNSTDPNGDTLAFNWEFGDGATGSGETVSHTYTAAGQYTVLLTVSDGDLSATDALTVSIASGVDTESFELPDSFVLKTAYPNPFNPTTTVTYGLPSAAEVRIIVTDLLGRQVATLAEGTKVAGFHTVQFNAGSLASGTYLIRMEASDFVATQQVVLLK